ncbi:MAG: hypothetical protein GXP30_08165 [Verrucomicrobia bacterium]|nr:hypothetical protein [Verrucomicrobiota bacterium]
MKLSVSSFLILGASLFTLSSCVTTPTAQKMREANTMLKQSAKKAEKGDYAGANSAAAAIGSGVRGAVELAPVVQSKTGKDVNLKPLLAAWESGPYKDLRKALAGSQEKAATAAFTNLRGQCTNCHTAIGRPEIRVN